MRKNFLFAGGAALVLAACSGTKKSADADFKKDLELASSSDGLAVAPAGQGTQVVSAIERTAPAPKSPAPASRVRKYHRAPVQTVAPVVADAPSQVTQPEPTPVTSAPAVDPQPQISTRPQPQVSTYPGPESGSGGTVSSGPGAGSIIGAVLGAVLRGAIVGGMGDGDSCDPRTEGRHGGAVNRRYPGGGFPGGGGFPSGGMTFPGRRF